MPPGVIVVKRRRRRAFAVLWAAPAWIRAFFAGRRAPPPPLPPVPALRRSVEETDGPQLVLGGIGVERCESCGAELDVPAERRLDPRTLEGWPRAAFTPEEAARLGCLRCLDPHRLPSFPDADPDPDQEGPAAALAGADAREGRVA